MKNIEDIFPHLRKERNEEIKRELSFLRRLLKAMESD